MSNDKRRSPARKSGATDTRQSNRNRLGRQIADLQRLECQCELNLCWPCQLIAQLRDELRKVA